VVEKEEKRGDKMAKESLTKYFKRNLTKIVLAYALIWFVNNFTDSTVGLSFPIGWAIFIVFFAILDLATEKILRV
jgi:hypothetical protein